MKRFTFCLLAAALMAFTAVSCSDDEPYIDEPGNGDGPAYEESTVGLFVLNSGKMGNNNAALSYYDFATKQVSTGVFEVANGKKLGDTGNSMVVYGKKMYIAVTNSAMIFVTDLKGNLLKEITVAGESANMSPRQLAKVDGKVYVSFMEGYVGAIDTASLSVKTVKVGPMPEGMAYSNKKVYVANSDGYNWPYGKTVSVIDPTSFTVTKTLEVSNNPQTLHVAANNTLYLICWGDYGDVPAKLQKINTSNDVVTTVEDVVPTNMTVGKDGIAYILSSVYDADWNQTITYYTFDTAKGKITGEFVSSADVPNGYCISADDLTGNVYIGTSDYVNNGDVYIIAPDGQIINKFDTGAMNPIAICPIRK